MAIRNRQALKTSFQNGAIPTAQHYGHLIDSMLNKWDDKFHGRWRPGIEYREGDVVIWGKTMYMLVQPPADTQPKPQKASKSAAPLPSSSTGEYSYCSTTAPPDDLKHWCQLQFDFEDKDWKINATEKYIYAHPDTALKVGIGVNQSTVPPNPPNAPEAKLHIYEEGRGEFLFNPDGATRTEFRMEAFDQPDCAQPPYFSEWLDSEFTHAETNACRGFTFDFMNPKNPAQEDPAQLMVIIGEKDKPEVGIGTENPTATLEINDLDKSNFLVNPTDNPEPELRLTNIQPDQNEACISATVHSDFADLTTNAVNGFRFGPKEPPQRPQAKSTGNPAEVVAVNTGGKVGIGTEAPSERLHVTDQVSGTFQVCLDRPNPFTAILNLEDTPEKSTVFAIGVDDAAAILQTDAPCGFVFRLANEPGHNAAPDLNAGEDLVWIDQQGKLGIGKAPAGYQADVNGSVRQYENYLPLNKNTMDNLRPLENALNIVCGLHPLRFVWKNNPDGKLKEGDHFGLRDTDVEQAAKEVCKTVTIGSTKEKAVNMVELVPVLIKAIQEQQSTIDDLKNRVKALEIANSGAKQKGYGKS